MTEARTAGATAGARRSPEAINNAPSPSEADKRTVRQQRVRQLHDEGLNIREILAAVPGVRSTSTISEDLKATEPSVEPSTPKPIKPAPDASDPVDELRYGQGKAAKLTVDLATQQLGEIIDRFGNRGAYKRDGVGTTGVTIQISRDAFRLIAEVTSPITPNTGPRREPLSLSAGATLDNPEVRRSLTALARTQRETKVLSHTPMLVVVEPSAGDVSHRYLLKLAQEFKAAVLLVEDKPGRPTQPLRDQLTPLTPEELS